MRWLESHWFKWASRVALPHLSEAFWGASGACKVNYRWKVKQLLPFGCLLPLPWSDEMSDKQQGRLGVCLHVKGGCKISVLAGPLGSCDQELSAVTVWPALRLRFHKQLSMLTALSCQKGKACASSSPVFSYPDCSHTVLTLSYSSRYDSVFPLGFFLLLAQEVKFACLWGSFR